MQKAYARVLATCAARLQAQTPHRLHDVCVCARARARACGYNPLPALDAIAAPKQGAFGDGRGERNRPFDVGAFRLQERQQLRA